MPTGIQFDAAWSQRIESIYRTPDVVSQRQAVLKMLDLQSGERVLDIGSGPGMLARSLGESVGSDGGVWGVDVSEDMNVLARARCADQPWVSFKHGEATALDFEDGYFDVAVSTQVYKYVEDLQAALAELNRVLRPGGRAAILDTDFGSVVWHTADKERMNRILEIYNSHCAHPYLPRTLAHRLTRVGFAVQTIDSVVMLNPEYDEQRYSYGLAAFIAEYVRGRHELDEAEVDAWLAEFDQQNRSGQYFFSLNRYLFLAIKP